MELLLPVICPSQPYLIIFIYFLFSDDAADGARAPDTGGLGGHAAAGRHGPEGGGSKGKTTKNSRVRRHQR